MEDAREKNSKNNMLVERTVEILILLRLGQAKYVC